MEITREEIAKIAAAYSGDFAVYKVDGGRFITLYYSPDVPSILSMTGDEYDELISGDAMSIVFEKDRAELGRRISDMISGGGDILEVTYRVKNKKSDFAWVRAKLRVIGTSGGCPVMITVFVNTSISSRSFRGALNDSNSVIYIIEKGTYQLLYANEKAEKFFTRGKPYAGHTCWEFQKGGFTAPCSFCPLPRMKNGRYHEDEYRKHDSDDWYQMDLRDVKWFDRDAIEMCYFDITELARRRRGLEISSASLEKTINSIPVGVAVFERKNGESTLVSVNAKYCELFDFPSPEAMLKKHDRFQAVHSDDMAHFKAELQKIHNPDSHMSCVFRHIRKNGGNVRWYHIEGLSTSLDNCGGFKIFVCMSDVTQEKNAEAETHRSRMIYEMAAETAGLVMLEYDIRAHKMTLLNNKRHEINNRLFGIPGIIDNIPESLSQWIDDRDMETIRDAYRRLDEGEQDVTFEYWFRGTPDKEPRAEKLSYSTVFDSDGRPLIAYGIAQDITSQKIKEEEYALMYRGFTINTPDIVGSFRLNLTKGTCSEGRSREERILALQDSGTVDGFFQAIAEKVINVKKREEILKTFTRANLVKEFCGGRTQMRCKFPFMPPSGKVLWGEGFVTMVLNPYTNDIEATAFVRDITVSEKDYEILHLVADRQYDFISIINPITGSFEVRRKNNAFNKIALDGDCNIREQAMKAAEFDVMPEDREEFIRMADLDGIRSALTRDGARTFTYRCLYKDGTVHFKQIKHMWLDDSKFEILCLQSDVTEIYEKEQARIKELRSALDKADRANRAKEDFLSRISHDIRTPMNAIMNITNFAFDDIDDREKLRDDLKNIQSSNKFLLSLINDVLDISKIDSGNIELHPEPYPYSEHIANVRGIMEPMCAEKGLKCVIDRRHITGVIIADKVRLNQIVLNLLSNAIKYTPAGGTVSYTSDSQNIPGGKIRFGFEIADTGIGMSDEFKRKMFAPFTQDTDNPLRPRTTAGTGLGLSIVKRMVDLMGGTLRVESEVGKGTTVFCSIVFPRVRAAEEEKMLGISKTQQPEHKTIAALCGKVLLVEDNDINAGIAERMLDNIGISADRAVNGAEAVKMLEKSESEKYSAVLMDIQMPVMDGYEATQRIRALAGYRSKIPIIALTADIFPDAVKRGREAGMDDYLTKPMNSAELRGTLAKYIKQM